MVADGKGDFEHSKLLITASLILAIAGQFNSIGMCN